MAITYTSWQEYDREQIRQWFRDTHNGAEPGDAEVRLIEWRVRREPDGTWQPSWEAALQFTWPKTLPPRPPSSGPPIYGNFLAAPGFELGLGQMPILMFGAMTREQRQQVYDVYRRHDWRTLPLHYYQVYNQWSYDYRNRLEEYHDLLEEAIEHGLEPLGMVLNWHRGDPWPTLDDAKREIDRTLPGLLDVYRRTAMAWEANDHPLGKSEDVLQLARYIKGCIGTTELYLHYAPMWWSPTPKKVDSMDEWQFWTEVGRIERDERGGNILLDGLLLQLHPGVTVENDRHAVYEYANNPANAQGYVGRVVEYFHRKMAVFEFARTYPEWQVRQRALADHPKAPLLSGYC